MPSSQQYEVSNRLIAKNTLMLYVRMFLTMIVGLYTSRVVLKYLGVSDFGVYNIVGGVVGMLAFLNATMSGATSRFISYELGTGDDDKLKATFNSALLVHLGIALVVFVLLETVGLWFVNNKLAIPDGRMQAARIVYQLSVVSAMFGIIQVPFNACVIAHEKMSLYAYVEILNSVLKLLIVYLLVITPFDKLVSYAAMIAAVSLLILIIYVAYARYHFEECRSKFVSDKSIVKSILSFSGYNLFGNFGAVFNLQGINILINNFFGVVFNAASGLATTVANIVNSFASNIITAFRPSITKSYSSGNYEAVELYSVLAFKLAIYLFTLVAIPVIIEMDSLLGIWLTEVPAHTAVFCKMMLICLLFDTIRYIATITIHAVGKVKVNSLINGLLLTVNPFIVFLLFRGCSNVDLAYVCNICVSVILSITSVILMKYYLRSLSLRKVAQAIVAALISALISFGLSSSFSALFRPSFLRIVITTLLSVSILSVLTMYVSLDRNQRQIVLAGVRGRRSR